MGRKVPKLGSRHLLAPCNSLDANTLTLAALFEHYYNPNLRLTLQNRYILAFSALKLSFRSPLDLWKPRNLTMVLSLTLTPSLKLIRISC